MLRVGDSANVPPRTVSRLRSPRMSSRQRPLRVDYTPRSSTSSAPYLLMHWVCTTAPKHGVSVVDYHSPALCSLLITGRDRANLGPTHSSSCFASMSRSIGTSGPRKATILRGAYGPCAESSCYSSRMSDRPAEHAREAPFRLTSSTAPREGAGIYGARTVLIDLESPVKVDGAVTYTFELVPNRLTAMRVAFGKTLPSPGVLAVARAQLRAVGWPRPERHPRLAGDGSRAGRSSSTQSIALAAGSSATRAVVDRERARAHRRHPRVHGRARPHL